MVFPFENDAMAGKPLAYKLDIADSCMYVALKYLYAMYRNGLITRKYASEEKDTLARNWTLHKSRLEFLDRDSEVLKKRIGNASDEYKNNPTIENADKLYAAFYNLPEDWRNKK